VAVFKGARHSVVLISSITKQWLLEDNRTGNLYQVPPASGTGFVWDNPYFAWNGIYAVLGYSGLLAVLLAAAVSAKPLLRHFRGDVVVH